MYKMIFAGKSEYNFVFTYTVESKDMILRAIEKFKNSSEIRHREPEEVGENFISWRNEEKFYHIFWSKIG